MFRVMFRVMFRDDRRGWFASAGYTMYHDVAPTRPTGNIMSQDVLLGVTLTVSQADLPYLGAAGRLGEYPVVYRVRRNQLGGGFGDQDKHPHAWGVIVYVDGQAARVHSARGSGREWNSLDRLERWLREQGFWYWWVRNDLEPLRTPSRGTGEADDDEDEPAGRSAGPAPGPCG